jgi:hypothetical protein
MGAVSAANEVDAVSDQAPVISVVKGNPTPEEIAALVLVLAGSGRAPAAEARRTVSQWAAYWRSLRTPISPGPGSWRQSARI